MMKGQFTLFDIEPGPTKDGWCHSDMIFVDYAKGYSCDTCGTVCLGDMKQVEKYLQGGDKGNFNTRQIAVLETIRIIESGAQIKGARGNTIPRNSRTTKRTKRYVGVANCKNLIARR